MNCREEKIHDEIDNELDGNALFLYLDVSYEVTWQISLYTLLVSVTAYICAVINIHVRYLLLLYYDKFSLGGLKARCKSIGCKMCC